MNRWIVLCLALVLCACAEAPKPAPIIATVQGPQFVAERFNCGQKPLPPDPHIVAIAAASMAARYEADLDYWGQHCANKLQAVGNELRAAGQVVDLKGGP